MSPGSRHLRADGNSGKEWPCLPGQAPLLICSWFDAAKHHCLDSVDSQQS
jgi:hypothetical protein